MKALQVAEKQAAALKTRRLVLDQTLTLEEVESLLDMLEAAGVSPKIAAFEVSYDLAKIDSKRIEALLQTAGIGLEAGLAARLRRAWQHYVEECEASNLDAPRKGGSCCNRPPVK